MAAAAQTNRILANMGSVDALFVTLTQASYTAGGELVDAPTLGIARQPKKIIAINGSTSRLIVPFWDTANKKLRFYYPTKAHTHDLLLKNAAVVDGATTRINAGANLLGANTGGDLTVTGGGANGGVVSKGADIGTELTAADDAGVWELLVLY